ncbi:MAG: FkbM family methyltransferase [Rhizobacter sp.]
MSPAPSRLHKAFELGRLYCELATAFGPATAWRITRALRRAMRSAGSVSVQVPGLSSPVELRGHSSDAATFIQIFLRGDLDFPVPGPAPRVIVDVGANIGLASLYLARRYPDARIIAIEFETENFRQLQANTAAYPRIECVHAGLWPVDTLVAVANPDAAKWAHVPVQAAGGSEPGSAIRAVSMPTLMAELNIASIDLLKIDIEGSEYELFESPPEWMSAVKTVAIELHDHLRAGAGARFLAALRGRPVQVACRGEYLVCSFNG